MKTKIFLLLLLFPLFSFSQSTTDELNERVDTCCYTNSGHKITGDTLNHLLHEIINSMWNKETDGSTSLGWLLTGNVLNGANFLGSTNPVPVKIRCNNVEAIRVNTDGSLAIGYTSAPTNAKATVNGNVGIGTNAPTTNLEVAGNIKLSYAASTPRYIYWRDPINFKKDSSYVKFDSPAAKNEVALWATHSSSQYASFVVAGDSVPSHVGCTMVARDSLSTNASIGVNAQGKWNIHAGGTGSTTTEVVGDTASTNITSSYSGYKGITYDQDWSANFTSRSLIDKGYADATYARTQISKTSGVDATTTTLANVTGLSATLVSGASYSFEAILHVTVDLTGGHKYMMAGTATATTAIYEVRSLNNSTNADRITARITDLGTSFTGGTFASGTAYFTVIKGYILCNTGGTLTVQFAQFAANGTSSVLNGSILTVTRID